MQTRILFEITVAQDIPLPRRIREYRTQGKKTRTRQTRISLIFFRSQLVVALLSRVLPLCKELFSLRLRKESASYDFEHLTGKKIVDTSFSPLTGFEPENRFSEPEVCHSLFCRLKGKIHFLSRHKSVSSDCPLSTTQMRIQMTCQKGTTCE